MITLSEFHRFMISDLGGDFRAFCDSPEELSALVNALGTENEDRRVIVTICSGSEWNKVQGIVDRLNEKSKG